MRQDREVENHRWWGGRDPPSPWRPRGAFLPVPPAPLSRGCRPARCWQPRRGRGARLTPQPWRDGQFFPPCLRPGTSPGAACGQGHDCVPLKPLGSRPDPCPASGPRLVLHVFPPPQTMSASLPSGRKRKAAVPSAEVAARDPASPPRPRRPGKAPGPDRRPRARPGRCTLPQRHLAASAGMRIPAAPGRGGRSPAGGCRRADKRPAGLRQQRLSSAGGAVLPVPVCPLPSTGAKVGHAEWRYPACEAPRCGGRE
ncbi:uncharacterized protein LOC128971302 [Indicator indicator]|uniref:uncharacterized protein LOC128971302 n=1 Tax=Indicator indicator TaxID=1002788 RepID=UPI0023DF5599|nr:uncharacterized protein LOC128971302 [Indicator indicator]